MGDFENEASRTESPQNSGRASDCLNKAEATKDREGATTGSVNVLRKAMWLSGRELTEREVLILSALLKLPDAQLAAIVRLACAR